MPANRASGISPSTIGIIGFLLSWSLQLDAATLSQLLNSELPYLPWKLPVVLKHLLLVIAQRCCTVQLHDPVIGMHCSSRHHLVAHKTQPNRLRSNPGDIVGFERQSDTRGTRGERSYRQDRQMRRRDWAPRGTRCAILHADWLEGANPHTGAWAWLGSTGVERVVPEQDGRRSDAEGCLRGEQSSPLRPCHYCLLTFNSSHY
ncbi:uncharacterized protein C8Q71DRAFT_194349 [Rhodofomes roseus]|uniref:Secreted protein n=1 Tax=Rhodofomes roseus TaxID=34475 RepID=A0ABQ8K7H3_9APHY|nr:uncharacterized protein C8Q71DRAFT_194349 [Rhodofomes roseus]KAH9833211.1 hypothetical protein C8Q71DRAFT_194349 [Rhodofomes roseus]